MTWIRYVHLIISIIIVVPTAFIYGSQGTVERFLDVDINTIDEANQMKAIMFFYLGSSSIWLLGVLKPNIWWLRATQLNMLFMFSLGIGRLISILVDGLPSSGYIFGVITELGIGVIAYYQLINYKSLSKMNRDVI